jgi:Tfp pilus assembly protein PilN
MAQQVNLCFPILRKQKSRFAAQTLVVLLIIIVVVGGALGGAWVWSLNRTSDSLKKTLDLQTAELDGLRAALERGKVSAAPAAQAQAQDIKNRQALLQQRKDVLQALSQGVFKPGFGHSDRLQLLARSIPAQVWVTLVRTDDQVLDVTGYTLSTEVINDWVASLAASPLLKGQALSTVKLDSVAPESVLKFPAALQADAIKSAASSPVPTAQAPVLPSLWSFNLISSMAGAQAPATPVSAPAGATASALTGALALAGAKP